MAKTTREYKWVSPIQEMDRETHWLLKNMEEIAYDPHTDTTLQGWLMLAIKNIYDNGVFLSYFVDKAMEGTGQEA